MKLPSYTFCGGNVACISVPFLFQCLSFSHRWQLILGDPGVDSEGKGKSKWKELPLAPSICPWVSEDGGRYNVSFSHRRYIKFSCFSSPLVFKSLALALVSLPVSV